jgi:para-nitrobenzyl esterase
MPNQDSLVGQVTHHVPVEHVQRIAKVYYHARTRRGEPASNVDILLAMLTDRESRISALRLVEAINASRGHAYNYIFTWCSPAMGGRLGACHALETGFVFGTYNESFGGKGPEASALSTAMQDAWLAFARTGDPSTPALPWPEYGKDPSTMMFGKQSYLAKAPYEEERKAWEGVPDFSGD